MSVRQIQDDVHQHRVRQVKNFVRQLKIRQVVHQMAFTPQTRWSSIWKKSTSCNYQNFIIKYMLLEEKEVTLLRFGAINWIMSNLKRLKLMIVDTTFYVKP